MIGFCPFCQTKQSRPAFAVYRDHYFCHRCNVTGTAFDWLQTQEGMTFPDAAQYLADMARITIGTNRVNRACASAPKRDMEACRWWWKRRRDAVRAAFDEEMDWHGTPAITADGEVTDDWVACLLCLGDYVNSAPLDKRLANFRQGLPPRTGIGGEPKAEKHKLSATRQKRWRKG